MISEKIKDLNAVINYFQALHGTYNERIYCFIYPRTEDHDKFINAEIGFGNSLVKIIGDINDPIVLFKHEGKRIHIHYNDLLDSNGYIFENLEDIINESIRSNDE